MDLLRYELYHIYIDEYRITDINQPWSREEIELSFGPFHKLERLKIKLIKVK